MIARPLLFALFVSSEMILEVGRRGIARDVLSADVTRCVETLIVGTYNAASLLQMDMFVLLHLAFE